MVFYVVRSAEGALRRSCRFVIPLVLVAACGDAARQRSRDVEAGSGGQAGGAGSGGAAGAAEHAGGAGGIADMGGKGGRSSGGTEAIGGAAGSIPSGSAGRGGMPSQMAGGMAGQDAAGGSGMAGQMSMGGAAGNTMVPEPPSGPSASFSQSAIDAAVAANLMRWHAADSVGAEYGMYKVLHTGRAAAYLMYVEHLDPGRSATGGKAVLERLLEQIRYVMSGGKEPMARGVIAGWADNSLAQILALAKHTPHVWDRLSEEEKEKADWLMRALAIAGNWCQNARNYVHTGLAQSYNWRKRWNPNHQEGYVGVMVAAHIYFGGTDAVNQILVSFDYDTYINKLTQLGFTNIVFCWRKAGRALMENGGTDARGGISEGVKIPFSWELAWEDAKPQIPYDPVLMYRGMASRTYRHRVTNRSAQGKGFLISGSSPVLGETGMGFEFQAGDTGGERSSARYVYDGWMNSVMTLATLVARGHTDGTGVLAQTVAHYMVGTTDLLYKLKVGYNSHANGSSKVHNEDSVATLGFAFMKDLHEGYLVRL